MAANYSVELVETIIEIPKGYGEPKLGNLNDEIYTEVFKYLFKIKYSKIVLVLGRNNSKPRFKVFD
jgi:hypothetical protein